MAGHSNAEPTDPALVREHQQSWAGFTHFVKWGTIAVCALMLLLYFFVAR